MVGSKPVLVFTIDVNGRPTVAFEAAHLREAYELCRQSRFSDDLSSLTSKGVPLWRLGSKMKARTASVAERASDQAAAEAVPQLDELFLFLVDTP